MTFPNWQQVQGFPSLQWAETGEPGALYVRDVRVVLPGVPWKIVKGQDEFTYWVAEHSSSDAYIPFGDWVATVASRLGLKACIPCAKRRAWLNSLLPRSR